MNPQHEKELETEIGRELKALPELVAPHTLILRVLAAIEARVNLPWFRRAWQTWPRPLRFISLALLLGAFGALCYGGLQLSQIGSAVAAKKIGWILSSLGAIWHALGLLVNAMSLALGRIPVLYLVGLGAAASLGYALCLGLGAVYFRIAFSRGSDNSI